MGWVTIPKQRWFELPREFNLRRDAALMRGPIDWSWDVTNQCVSTCLHCFNRSGVLSRDELADDAACDLMRQIAELEPLAICLCGGEPLLRSELVLEATRILATTRAAISMVTNGYLLTADLAARLRGAGMRLVQVSVDGATAASHERLRQLPGAFERAWAAIGLLVEAGITVGVSFAPTAFNITEWRQVYDRCREAGVTDMRMQPLMPLGQCVLNFDEIAPSQEQYRALIEALQEVPACEMRLEWGDPIDHLIRFGQYYSMVTHMMHVTADGFLAPSVYLPVYLGNVRRHTIEEYWEAGMGRAWQLEVVREMAYRLRSNRDFAAMRPSPFFDAPIVLDLVDLSPEGIRGVSDTALDFIERFWPAPDRPGRNRRRGGPAGTVSPGGARQEDAR
jgi:Fe-coproporphyrin III synthase